MRYLIHKVLRKFGLAAVGDLNREIQTNRLLTAKLLVDQLINNGRIDQLQDAEFKVYSQWGEDGIIQYLLHKLSIERDLFVEFGVENYLESNTRFLLLNNNWTGLVIDGDPENVSFIRSDPIYWAHELEAVCSFITRDNINGLLKANNATGDIGLLSVDIDGNDYWVWQAIDVAIPRIVVCEYNSLWGPRLAVTTPYEAEFSRTRAHYSNLYFGASITALTQLAKSRGYSLVGSNSAGNNLFFVRDELLGDLVVMAPAEAWVKSRFRESRDDQGALSYLSAEAGLALLGDMPLVNLEDGQQHPISELFGPG